MPVVRAFEAPCMVLSNKLQNIFAKKFFSFFSLLAKVSAYTNHSWPAKIIIFRGVHQK